jgi:hypothetical protein
MIQFSLLDKCQNDNSVCKQRVPRTPIESLRLDTLLRSFWIGMHRLQYKPYYNSSVDCSWNDGTICDYGRFDGIASPDRNVAPWTKGNPSGSNNSAQALGCISLFFNLKHSSLF